MSQVGDIQYRAPETFTGMYGVQVDTWAVGVIAFEMLTGILPFKSFNHKKTLTLICNE